MKKNMGNTDRMIRVIVAVIAAVLFFTKVVPAAIGIALMVVAGIFLLTSVVSICPIYSIFGLSTCPVKTPEA